MLHRDKTSRLTIAFTLCALVACGPVRADDWNVGLKRLSLPGPVNGAAMVGIVTYPTTALTSSLTVGRFRLVAAEDARPATGKFPLVIFSHGTGSQPELYLWLFEGLTAKGFVVAGLAHPKDNSNDRSGSFGDALLVDRAQHISALIDHIEHDERIGGTIEGEKIGVIGHSAGGYTAIVSAGAMPDFSQFDVRCRRDVQPRPDRPRFTHNLSLSPAPDRRVRAVAAMAPALGCLFDRENLSEIHVPIRFYQADSDEILQPGFNAAYFASQFDYSPDLVHIANAGHFIFLNTCPFIMSLLAREICFDPRGTSRDDVHHRLVDDIALFFAHALDSKLH